MAKKKQSRRAGRPSNPVPADAPPLARNLRRLREERGQTQQEVADSIGLATYSAIARYEMGEIEPTASILMALARHFGVSAEQLYG